MAARPARRRGPVDAAARRAKQPPSRSSSRIRRVRARSRRRTRCLEDARSVSPSRRMGSSTGRRLAGMGLDANGDGRIRMQWCHGAPGIIATLHRILDEELAVAGGELTWTQGHCARRRPLPRHGRQRLRVPRATPAERRRALARAGAHVRDARRRTGGKRARTKHRHGHYSLWTGDLGTALYLADCVDGGGEPRLPEPARVCGNVP